MKTLELIEKSLKKSSTQQLVSKLEKLNEKSQEFGVIVSILEKRSYDVSKWKNIDPILETIDGSDSKTEEEFIDLNPTLRDKLIEEVDQFVDELIASKRTGVYTEVMKALGGQFESDLDELFERSSEEQLKEALSFKNLKKDEINKVDSLIKKGQELKKQEVKKEKKNTSVKKSIILEESKEIEGLILGSNVEFKTSSISKFPNQILKGVVIKFNYDKTDKEFIQIKSENSLFWKRSNLIKII